MNETVLLIAVLIFGALLIIGMILLVLQLRHRFVLEETKRPQSKPSSKPKSIDKKVILLVNSREFEVFYKEKDGSEVTRLTELIKYSLTLLKDTKYPDIIASRAKETESLIRQLPKITTLSAKDLNEILSEFREFVASIG